MGKFEEYVFEVLTLGFSDASRVVLNGNLVAKDPYLRRRSQRIVTVPVLLFHQFLSPSMHKILIMII